MINKSKSFCILISTSDKYHDVFMIMLEALKRYLIDSDVKVYINSETNQFNKLPSNFQTINYQRSRVLSNWYDWGDRFLQSIDHIPEEYILHILDDFFPVDYIDTDLIQNLILVMKQQSVEVLQLDWDNSETNKHPNSNHTKDDLFNFFKLVDNVVFHPTIWRKSTLKKIVRKHESIWSFEVHGSIRLFRDSSMKNKAFLIDYIPVWPFLREEKISAIVNGKILDSVNTRQYYKNLSIDIDSMSRQLISISGFRNIKTIDNIKSYSIPLLFFKTVKRLVSKIY
jgi:hypothetical protein